MAGKLLLQPGKESARFLLKFALPATESICQVSAETGSFENPDRRDAVCCLAISDRWCTSCIPSNFALHAQHAAGMGLTGRLTLLLCVLQALQLLASHNEAGAALALALVSVQAGTHPPGMCGSISSSSATTLAPTATSPGWLR